MSLAPAEPDLMDDASVIDGLNAQFPLAGPTVDGRTVRSHIPNTGSIEASLTVSKCFPGVRAVPFSAFTQMGDLTYGTLSDERRTRVLVDQIRESEELNPLIVVIDDQGPYILEGGHRFDALREMNAASFPALVVLDLEAMGLDEDFDVGVRPALS